jgi:ElaB/YqjD/DUF883 family membrane-anchored ribosome-binding protein
MFDRDRVDELKKTVTGAASHAAHRVADALPTGRDVRRGADSVGRFIHDNPIGAVIGSAALGFIFGILLPATALETDRMRDVRRAARDASAEAIEAGRQVMRETVWTTLGGRRPNGKG